MTSLYEIRQKAQRAEGQTEQIRMTPSSTAGKDYTAIYETIRAYHERHNPPRLTDEYWQSAVKGISEAAASLDNDPFALVLLEAVYSEMEREYNILKASNPPAAARTA